MIHPVRKYSSLPLLVLALIVTGCAAHGATLVLGYGGDGVYPRNATGNSERYFRAVLTIANTEVLTDMHIVGVGGTTQIFPKPNGNWNDPSDGVTRYLISGGSSSVWAYTIGPYAGYDYRGVAHCPTEVIGQVRQGTGGENFPFTIYATTVPASGGTSTTISDAGTYNTGPDNAAILDWWSGMAAGVDPLSVDGPVAGQDYGSSSSTFTFRVQYRMDLHQGLDLLPRFGTSTAPGTPRGNFANFDNGRANATQDQDWSADWWTYGAGAWAWSTPTGAWSSLRPRMDDFADQTGESHIWQAPEVVLIIDGDRSRPHYMIRENPNDSEPKDANGIIYFYTLLPTDYQNFMDNLFLYPFDAPGDELNDYYAAGLQGRPASNNYVSMQVGNHTYEFLASADFSPPDGNRVWLQVGRPGDELANEYMRPIRGGTGDMEVTPVVQRYDDADGANGGHGYPYSSQSGLYPAINPMLTAHPYFPRGSIEPFQSGSALGVNPPQAAANPFLPELGAGPDPTFTPAGPWRVTNDDTILPNFANIRPETDATAPFRGGKWTSASTYTLRVNYWQSNNLPPAYIRVMIRRNDDGVSPGSWSGYTMEKLDATDTNYRDGCVYQYVTTPDQLPGGGGAGDYNYYFVTSDGIRQATFPNRPARYTYNGGSLDDPGDMGVASDSTGENDFYSFRVNAAPALTGQSVTQTGGATGDDFAFKVTYTDPDGQMLNTSSEGDRPFEASIYLDLFGNPNGEGRVSSVSNETTINYTTLGGTGYAVNELTGGNYRVEILSGTATGKTYAIASNTATQIVLASGSTALTDGVAATNRFRISNWFHGTMLPASAADTNYADGKDYVFNSATYVELGPGTHRYYFVFVDDWGCWIDPTDSNMKVEGETVRLPLSGAFDGPEVIQNTAPVLTDFRFTPDAASGYDGTTATPFIFSVTYTDQENNPPAAIRLGIDGTADAPATVLNMSPDNAGDTVYTDGAVYKTVAVKLTEGQHIFRAQASDGSLRYPASASNATFTFAGEPTTTEDHEEGPNVKANTPPTLSFQSTDGNVNDATNPPGLDPNTGRVSTTFTYTVIYTDTDQFAGVAGNPPDYVRVVIDGTECEMTKVDSTDDDYTDGAVYQYSVTGLVEGTPHRYWFIASDGLDRARLPVQGATPSYYNGPIVDEPPGAPQALLAQDHANDNGGVIDLTFNASQDDGGGANDVTEYRLYRTTTSGSYPTTPLQTITATKLAAYTLQDTTAVTGTQYYYMVRAWDGANESADSTPAGPVSAIDNIPPEPPSNVAAIDPGLGGTVAVTWTPSPDDGGGQNDVKEYHIYRATTATGFSTMLGTAAAGETSYSDTTAADGTDYYYMVRAYDGTNESVDSNVFGPVQSTDQQPPVIADQFPADRALDIAPGTNISFTVSDSGTGVDRTKLTTTVTADGVAVDVGTPTITGTAAKYTVVYNPANDFAYRAVVNVTVEAYDLGGKTATSSWRFTVAGPPTYTISGSVRSSTGVGLENVVVSTGDQWALTNAAGDYTIVGMVNGTYTVTPTLRGYAFTPTSKTATIADANATGMDFVWQPAFDITGIITDGNGAGMQGVTVTVGSRTAVTNAAGVYQLLDLPAGDYTIEPSLSRYVFTPASRSVTLGPTATNQNFVGALETFSISGVITDLNGSRLGGVTVTATGDTGTGTAVSNDAGTYTISGLLPGAWTVQPALTGYVFRPASESVALDASVTEVNFVGVPIYTVNLPAGLSFLSLPITPENTSPVAVFGALPNFRWDPSGEQYHAGNTDPTLELVQVKVGRGFWVRTDGATVLNVAGTPTRTSVNYTLLVYAGWSMVGTPYAAALPWANVGVTAGGPVSDYAYIYQPGTGYVLVSDASGVGALTSVPQHAAMWMKSTSARAVTVSALTTTVTAEQATWTRSSGEFVIPIHAQAAGTMDTTARAGVVTCAASNPAAYVMENPPFIGNSVDVYFTDGKGTALTCDIRGASASSLTYNFTVKTDLQDVPVKVSLPDLSQVPRDKAVYLTDVASGKRLWARTLSGYTYNSGTGGERQFRLEVVPNVCGGLSVVVSPTAVKGGGVALTYTLSRPASVQMTIMNVAGRQIRVLTRDAAGQAGVNTAAWDLRSDSGLRVPAGRYLVRVQAAAEDGQQVTTVAPLLVQ